MKRLAAAKNARRNLRGDRSFGRKLGLWCLAVVLLLFLLATNLWLRLSDGRVADVSLDALKAAYTRVTPGVTAVPGLARLGFDTGRGGVQRLSYLGLMERFAPHDSAAFAEWVSYPIRVTADGEEMSLEDAGQFVDHYDQVLTDEIRSAVTDQAWADLFVNDQGIMFGNGQVWLNGICRDESCARFDVKVVAIQSAN